jgi:LmbE family N-acetylglucosaminyl deacetylase
MENPFSPPDLTTAQIVLAVQPHYDDNDIAAGGTIAALAQNGAEIYYLTVTNDLVGVIDQTLNEAEMTQNLRGEQAKTGSLIGVKEHYWLEYPDAGKYDYYDLRKEIIKHIRLLRPDFIFTCDPWTPYEAHQDHLLTGKATAEAAILYGLMRLTTSPEVDNQYTPHELKGIVFYATAYPNTVYDISETTALKHQALDIYKSQFTEEELAMLKMFLQFKEQEVAKEHSFSHGESLKVLRPLHLHVFPDARIL